MQTNRKNHTSWSPRGEKSEKGLEKTHVATKDESVLGLCTRQSAHAHQELHVICEDFKGSRKMGSDREAKLKLEEH